MPVGRRSKEMDRVSCVVWYGYMVKIGKYLVSTILLVHIRTISYTIDDRCHFLHRRSRSPPSAKYDERSRTAVAYEGDRADEINALQKQFYSIIDRTDKENPAFHFCGEQIS